MAMGAGGGPAGLNFEAVTERMAENTAIAEKQLNDFSTSFDANDPGDLIRFQKKFQDWTLATDLQSTTLKNLKDMLRSIVQNQK